MLFLFFKLGLSVGTGLRMDCIDLLLSLVGGLDTPPVSEIGSALGTVLGDRLGSGLGVELGERLDTEIGSALGTALGDRLGC